MPIPKTIKIFVITSIFFVYSGGGVMAQNKSDSSYFKRNTLSYGITTTPLLLIFGNGWSWNHLLSYKRSISKSFAFRTSHAFNLSFFDNEYGKHRVYGSITSVGVETHTNQVGKFSFFGGIDLFFKYFSNYSLPDNQFIKQASHIGIAPLIGIRHYLTYNFYLRSELSVGFSKNLEAWHDDLNYHAHRNFSLSVGYTF